MSKRIITTKLKTTTMTAKQFTEYLEGINACEEAIKWQQGKSINNVWKKCERGDWMLWLIHKADLCNLKLKILIKVECAELVAHLMTDERSKNALKVARSFALGESTREELDAAADAAADADAAYAAAAAAAAYAAAAAADAAADAAYAAADAADAADAAAAYAAARKETLKKCADICRKYLPNIKIINND